MSGTTIGVLGATWRATVTPWGDVLPWGDEPPLQWHVAADDRWHAPAEEFAVRQHRVDGTPVVETRLRVPSGDAIQRVWATADGLTVVEVENDSALPIAVAFSRSDVLTSRPVTDVPIEGIDLPEGTIVLPVGHRSTVRVALTHGRRGAGRLPDDVAPAMQVARGWTTVTERAGRLVVAEPGWADEVVAQRCRVALEGPDDPAEDPVAFLIGVGELIRLGDQAEPWVIDVVEVAEPLMRCLAKTDAMAWDVRAALAAASRVLARAGERRGCDDVEEVLARAPGISSVAMAMPDGVRAIAWIEQHLARPAPGSACDLFPAGIPTSWLGANTEAYHLPAGPRHTVSFAIRWHGERPAVLWEVDGPSGLRLTGGAADPLWHTDDPRGEALLGVPPGAAPTGSMQAAPPDGSDTSFS